MAIEDCGNLDIQKQINEVLEARAAHIAKTNELLRGQISISEKLAEILNLANQSAGIKDLAGSLNESAAAAEKNSSALLPMSTNLNQIAKKDAPGLGKSMTDVSKTGKTAFSKLKDVVGGLIGVFGSVTRSIVGIGGSLLSIPMGILSTLMDEAADLANRGIVLAEAFEQVRSKFGSLASNEGKALTGSYKNIAAESSNLAGSGMRLSSIYGSGPEGLAKMMGELSATAEAMGPVFSALGDQFEKNAASILIMKKGMSISDEAMKSLGATALARGQDINDSLKDIGNLSVQMGKKFGISSKLIGKDIASMKSNMAKFGQMTTAQMATSAVYVRKLGLEIKDLEGLTSAFDDFEGAATASSKLAQSFGMNIDAMEMMKEKDPSKQLDMLRKSFAATGKSIGEMSRQEKALLATTTGMDANMIEAALSAENMGMSYDEISAAAEGAADKQLSQEEIMQNMATNIEKVFEPIQYLGSLFKTFFNGFVMGAMKAGPMREALHAIMNALKAVGKFGRMVGDVFINSFPGVADMLAGIRDHFQGLADKLESVTKNADGFREYFKKLFAEFSKDPQKAIEKFTNFVTEKFKSLFGDTSGGGSKILEGIGKFIKFLFLALLSMLPKVLNIFTDLINKLTNMLSNLEGAGESIFTPVFKAIKAAAKPLMLALFDLFVEAFKAVAPILLPIIGAYLGLLLLKAAAIAVGGAVMAKIKDMIMGALGVGTNKKPDALDKKYKGAAETIVSVIRQLGRLTLAQIGKAMLVMTALTALMIGSLAAFAYAVAESAKLFKGVSWGQVGMSLGSMLAGIISLGLIVEISKKIKTVGIVKAGIVLAAAGYLVEEGIQRFSKAVSDGAKLFVGIEWEQIQMVFASVGFGLLATFAVAGIAAAIGGAGAQVLGIGLLGLLVAGIFVAVGITGFAYVVKNAVEILKDVAWPDIEKLFAAVGVGIAAVVGIAIAAIALAAATPAMAAGIITLPLAAWFLKKGVTTFAEAINEITTSVTLKDPAKVEKIFGAILISMKALGALVLGAAAFATMGPAVLFLIPAVWAMSKFFSSVSSSLASGLGAINDIQITDPDMMQKKVEIVGKLVEAMSKIGELAINAGKLDNASRMFNNDGASTAITLMGTFLEKIKTTITELLTTIVTMASNFTNYPKGTISRAVGIAEIIGKIAEFASSLAAPIGALAGMQGFEGQDLGPRIRAIMKAVSKIIDKIGESLPKLLTDIVTAAATIPAGFTKEKADIFAAVMGPIAGLISALVSPLGELCKVDEGMFENATTKVDKIVNSVSTILGSIETSLPKIIGVIATTNVEGLTEDKAKTIAAAISSIAPFTDSMSTIMKQQADGGLDVDQIKLGFSQWKQSMYWLRYYIPDITRHMSVIADDLDKYKDRNLTSIVTAVINDIKTINTALLGLEDINMQATVDKLGESIGLKDATITLDRKPIQVTVNLQLTMKAEDIAKELFTAAAAAVTKDKNDPKNSPYLPFLND